MRMSRPRHSRVAFQVANFGPIEFSTGDNNFLCGFAKGVEEAYEFPRMFTSIGAHQGLILTPPLLDISTQ